MIATIWSWGGTPAVWECPWAWAKLLDLRDQGPTEIGGFGIAAADDPLCLEDVVLVRQSCTAVTVQFEDPAVADFFDAQIDQGRKPEQFARVWIHTHPGTASIAAGLMVQQFSRWLRDLLSHRISDLLTHSRLLPF